jgi:hypothetical protein
MNIFLNFSYANFFVTVGILQYLLFGHCKWQRDGEALFSWKLKWKDQEWSYSVAVLQAASQGHGENTWLRSKELNFFRLPTIKLYRRIVELKKTVNKRNQLIKSGATVQIHGTSNYDTIQVSQVILSLLPILDRTFRPVGNTENRRTTSKLCHVFMFYGFRIISNCLQLYIYLGNIYLTIWT